MLDSPELLNMAQYKTTVYADETGNIYSIDSKNIGKAIVNLGGGRQKKEDFIDNTVGIEVLKKIGDSVEAGEPILYIYSNDDKKAEEEAVMLQRSFKYASVDIPKIEEIIDVIEWQSDIKVTKRRKYEI